MNAVTINRSPIFQVGRFGFQGLLWIIRKCLEATAVSLALVGAFFVLLTFGSALPMFSRAVIFHPETVKYLEVSFFLIVTIYLSFSILYVLFCAFDSFWDRAKEDYPVLDNAETFFMVAMASIFAGLLILFVIFGSNPTDTMQNLSLVRLSAVSIPQDRVLLHLNVPTHGKKVRIGSKEVPPPLWVPANIEGAATVKSLGHGRYEVQMVTNPKYVSKEITYARFHKKSQIHDVCTIGGGVCIPGNGK